MKALAVAGVLVALFIVVFVALKPAPAPPRGTTTTTFTLKAGVPPTPDAKWMTKGMTPAWPPARDQAPAPAADLFAANYYVVFDGSGSMNEKGCSGGDTKIRVAKAALAAFAQAVPAQANLGLQVFDAGGVRERLPLGTGNRDQFTRLVNEVRANAGTPLREAVRQAYLKLQEQGAKQLGYGEYHLVIVTDGQADQGQDPTSEVNRLLGESPIVVQTIGFCIGTQHSLNQPGRTIYRAADNAQELTQGLADVLAEAPQFAVTQFK